MLYDKDGRLVYLAKIEYSSHEGIESLFIGYSYKPITQEQIDKSDYKQKFFRYSAYTVGEQLGLTEIEFDLDL